MEEQWTGCPQCSAVDVAVKPGWYAEAEPLLMICYECGWTGVRAECWKLVTRCSRFPQPIPAVRASVPG